MCMNTIPGYVCECNLGYSLNSDNSSCVANANCSEGECYCLDGFTDISGSGNGSLNSINCIGKFFLVLKLCYPTDSLLLHRVLLECLIVIFLIVLGSKSVTYQGYYTYLCI